MYASLGRQLVTLLVGGWVAVASSGQLPAQSATSPDNLAAKILDEARKALGGADKLQAVRELELQGQRVLQNLSSPSTNPMTLRIALPDKFLKTVELRTFAGLVQVRGVNAGDLILRHQVPAGIRISNGSAEQQRAQAADLERELSRLLIGLLLTDRTPIGVAYAHAGRAQSRDGEADVLEVTGRDGFALRLFIDAATRRPLMLTYSAPARRKLVESASAEGGRTTVAVPGQGSEERRIYFSEYRSVQGILLPHLLITTAGGDPFEQFTIEKIVVNPGFAATTFNTK